MNKVILIGRLTKDPELRYTNNDIPVVQFTLAVDRGYTSRDAERKADFISCVVWRASAENLAKYMKKGGQICVEGQLQVRTFEDKGGVRRYVTEVICEKVTFLGSRSDRSDNQFSGYNDINQYDIPNDFSSGKMDDVFNDESPFKEAENHFNVNSDDDLPF